MWILMIAALAAMFALTVLQTPREWFKNRLTRVLVIVFHTIGIVSILLILFAVYRMKDGALREIIIWTETFYFTVTAFALLLSAVRYFGFELARHFKHRKILKILSSQTAFFLAAILISAVYMIPSVYNATTLRTVTYDIQLEKSCADDSLSIAVISDFHVGAGARHSEMDQMVQLVQAAKPDVILIDGDICDSSSSVSDMEYMEKALKKREAQAVVIEEMRRTGKIIPRIGKTKSPLTH